MENDASDDKVDMMLFEMLSERSLGGRDGRGVGWPGLRIGTGPLPVRSGGDASGDRPTRSPVSIPSLFLKSITSDRKTSFSLLSRVKAISAEATRDRN